MVNSNSKRIWRFLTQKGKKTKLLSIRVPIDVPINSVELKEIVSELDIIVKNGKGNLSQPYLDAILKYYKSLGDPDNTE